MPIPKPYILNICVLPENIPDGAEKITLIVIAWRTSAGIAARLHLQDNTLTTEQNQAVCTAVKDVVAQFEAWANPVNDGKAPS